MYKDPVTGGSLGIRPRVRRCGRAAPKLPAPGTGWAYAENDFPQEQDCFAFGL